MRKLALVLAMIAATGAASCGRDDAAPAATVPAKDAVQILEGSPWLDKAPESETDVIHLYVFARGEGIYFVGNQHKGGYEAFRWFAEDDQLKLRFLDEGKTYQTSFQIQEIDDRVFDYKLTLSGSPRGPKVYYGFASHRDAKVPAVADRARALLE